MFGSFLPSLWSSSNQSLLGSRSRHCYAIKCALGPRRGRDFEGASSGRAGRRKPSAVPPSAWGAKSRKTSASF